MKVSLKTLLTDIKKQMDKEGEVPSHQSPSTKQSGTKPLNKK
jgi:hypothetical protein